EISADAKRDADAIGQELNAVQLGTAELTFHAESVLQRPVQALISRVEQVLVRHAIADVRDFLQLIENLVLQLRRLGSIRQRTHSRQIGNPDRLLTGIDIQHTGQIDPFAGGRIGIAGLGYPNADYELAGRRIDLHLLDDRASLAGGNHLHDLVTQG